MRHKSAVRPHTKPLLHLGPGRRVRALRPFILDDGTIHEFVAIIAGHPPVRGYVRASVTPVHAHACPNWRMGKKFGPCNCGATALFERYTR